MSTSTLFVCVSWFTNLEPKWTSASVILLYPSCLISCDILWSLMVFDGLWWLFSVLFVNGIDSVHSPSRSWRPVPSRHSSGRLWSPVDAVAAPCNEDPEARWSALGEPGRDSQEIIGDPDEIQLPSTSYIFLYLPSHLMSFESLVIISPVTQCYPYNYSPFPNLISPPDCDAHVKYSIHHAALQLEPET